MTQDNEILIEGEKPIFHVVLKAEDFGLTIGEARRQDMPSEYAVVQDEEANAGILIYAKYGDEWIPNPSSCRFLVRFLIEKL